MSLACELCSSSDASIGYSEYVNRIEKLKARVDAFYADKNTSREKGWADYLHGHHIYIVAETARVLTERFHGKADIAAAAAMLHNVADALMSREDPRHEQEGILIARSLLRACAFSDVEIQTIVDDAIKCNGCRGTYRPHTLEGKIMATADAMVNLQSDFYEFAERNFAARGVTKANISKWGLEKTDMDFKTRIFFPEIQDDLRPDFERERRRFAPLR